MNDNVDSGQLQSLASARNGESLIGEAHRYLSSGWRCHVARVAACWVSTNLAGSSMLEISLAQYGSLQQVAADRFNAELAAYLEETYPQLSAANFPAGLSELVRQLTKDALSFGIREERSIAWYADLACQFGSGFPRRADDGWALDILTRSDLAPEEKPRAVEWAFEQNHRQQVAGPPPASPAPRGEVGSTPELEF
jgi:hypothetical protein